MLNNVYMIATSPNFHKDGICFAATDKGLQKSQDGCKSWENTFEALSKGTSLSCTTVALSPNFEKDNLVFAGVKGGILVSENSAASWEVIEFPSPPPVISRITTSPAFNVDKKVFSATTDDGVFLSDDQGFHWKTWNFGLFDLNIYDMVVSPDFIHDQTLYLGTESGIFISINGGCSWRDTGFPMANGAVLSLAAVRIQNDVNFIYAGTENKGLFISKDKGKHWDCLIDQSVNGAVNQLLINKYNSNSPIISMLLQDRIIQSSNNGKNWSTLYEAEKDFSPLSCIASYVLNDIDTHYLIGTLGNGMIQI